MMEREMADRPSISAARPEEAQELTSLAFRPKAHSGYSPEFMQECRRELTVSPDRVESDRSLLRGGGREFAPRVLSLGVCFRWRLRAGCPFRRAGVDRIGGVGHAPIEHARRTASQIGATRLIIQGNPDAADFYLAWGDTLNRQSPDFTRGTDSRAQPQAHTSD